MKENEERSFFLEGRLIIIEIENSLVVILLQENRI